MVNRKRDERVIIFDWDDTICPSTFVDRSQIEHHSEMPKHFQKLLGELSKCAARCLHEASKYGEVIIITNSDDGWVKYSCERFVPKLLPVIEKYRIVSARTEYEKFYPGQPLCWKAAAFAHEVNEHFEQRLKNKSGENDDPLNSSYESLVSTDVSSDGSFELTGTKRGPNKEVISFGDSMEERAAVRIVAEQLSAQPKSVMFVQTPSPVQILGQLQMLNQHMKFICDQQTSLDLEISPDQALRFAESYMRRSKSFSDQTTLVKELSSMLLEQNAVAVNRDGASSLL